MESKKLQHCPVGGANFKTLFLQHLKMLMSIQITFLIQIIPKLTCSTTNSIPLWLSCFVY